MERAADTRAQGTEPVRAKRRRLYPLFQVGFVLLLLAAGWFSFGRNVLAPLRPRGVPEQLGEMRVASFIEGPQALAQVDKLHGSGIGLIGASVVEYSHAFNPYHGTNSERVTVWVGKAGSPEAADDLLQRMRDGIQGGGSAFGEVLPVEGLGVEAFQVQGPGGQHFFYVSSKNNLEVIWLTIGNSPDPLSILGEALEGF